MTGHTFSVKRMQTHDGPGLRTTVFMKGCSLRCAWCHNPESLSGTQEIWLDESKCIGCGFCFDEHGKRTEHATWNGELSVVENCPPKALQALREDWTPEDLLLEIKRDAGFFEQGGVTFSGGEPALQWPFVAEMMKACKATGLHTALDTCGTASAEAFNALLPHTDLVLFDLKIMDPEAHSKWTGRDNTLILDNLRKTAEQVRAGLSRLWIRTPLIPEATASVENLAAIGRFIKAELEGAVDRWELCSFNNLCADKYRRLQMEWCFNDTPLILSSEAGKLRAIALQASGLPERQVILKGRFRKP